MFWSCLFCVAACLHFCSGYFGVGICVVGLCVVVAVWLLDCVAVSRRCSVAALRRCVAEAARRRFTCRLRRATVLLFGRVIDTS